MNYTNYNSIKLADQLIPHIQHLKILQQLSDAFQMRIDCEESYQKSMGRVASKFSIINNNNPQSNLSKLLLDISKTHNQRTYQIINFKDSLKGQIDNLRTTTKQVSQELQTQINSLKKVEKDIKINYDKVEKSKARTQQLQKDLDQKIILNQIAKLHNDHSLEVSNKLMETTAKLLSEQKHVSQLHDNSSDLLSITIENFNDTLGKINIELESISKKIKGQFFDILKRYTIHEISLLRNTQYDVDSTIKKIEKQEIEAAQQPNIQILKIPSFHQSKLEDPFDKLRLQLFETENNGTIIEEDLSFKQKIEEAIVNGSNFNEITNQLLNSYHKKRLVIHRWLQGYRLINKFKFENEEYDRLKEIFRIINDLAYRSSDIDILQRILLFSVTYYRENKAEKRFLIEEIKDFKFYGVIEFWKFFCYYSLKSTLQNYRKNAVETHSENQIHERNSVYSTLLTCSTNMVTFGMEKHSIKNFLAKAGKSFRLQQNQISEILKFIEWQFTNKSS